VGRITVLGLGAMGSRLAVRCATAGHDVTVWNRTPATSLALADEHGFRSERTPRAAAAQAEIVVSMVSDDDAAREIWLDPATGALAALGADAVAVESSTLSPATVRALAAAAHRRGVAFVEAPVIGSRPQAEAGTLVALVGGAADALTRARPALDAFADAVHHLGPVGDAAVVKLAVNALFGVQVAAYAEVAALLAASGVDTAGALALVRELPITSPTLRRIVGAMAAGDHAPNFPIRLVAKDLRYLTGLAADIGADVPLGEAAGALYQRGSEGPERDLDIAGIALRYGLAYVDAAFVSNS